VAKIAPAKIKLAKAPVVKAAAIKVSSKPPAVVQKKTLEKVDIIKKALTPKAKSGHSLDDSSISLIDKAPTQNEEESLLNESKIP
jgi:hypothetical protein